MGATTAAPDLIPTAPPHAAWTAPDLTTCPHEDVAAIHVCELGISRSHRSQTSRLFSLRNREERNPFLVVRNLLTIGYSAICVDSVNAPAKQSGRKRT